MNRILIVDDEKKVCQLLEKYLGAKGFAVTSAHDGAEALAKCPEFDPQVALLDITMPKMNGVECLKQIKKKYPDTEVVMTTAITELKTAISCMQEGAFGYLTKPLDFENLVVEVNRSLEHRRLVLENKEMFLLLKKANLEIVRVLSEAIEAKDPYTRGHCDRVVSFSERLGKEMGLEQRQLEILEYGALLHDIGKIGVRGSILNKPGKLTDEEFEHIQNHPVIGEKILFKVDFLKEAMTVVKQHHERYDGKGYPRHLEHVDILSQIVSLADAYDAMTSNRPYRKGMPIERALVILEENAGSQFNPELVKVFIEEKLYILDTESK